MKLTIPSGYFDEGGSVPSASIYDLNVSNDIETIVINLDTNIIDIPMGTTHNSLIEHVASFFDFDSEMNSIILFSPATDDTKVTGDMEEPFADLYALFVPSEEEGEYIVYPIFPDDFLTMMGNNENGPELVEVNPELL